MARVVPAVLAAAMAASIAAPALAQNQVPMQVGGQSGYVGGYQGAPMYYAPPVWQSYQAPVYNGPVPAAPNYNGAPPPQAPQADPHYLEMVDKCQGVTHRNSGTTGAVIGGVVGGVVGNRIASDNRVLGTVAGAAVGAVAGGAIGKSVHRSRERECEEFFSNYSAPQQPGYGYSYGYAPAYPGGNAYGYPAYGYAPVTGPVMGYVMVPQGAAPAAPQGQGTCTETRTVTYEYVPVVRRYRGAPPRRPVVRDKRVAVPQGS
jgi:hypothetical protein